MLAATNKPSQLKFHVRAGLVNGLEPDEIRECLLHVMGYCGFPTGLEACVLPAPSVSHLVLRASGTAPPRAWRERTSADGLRKFASRRHPFASTALAWRTRLSKHGTQSSRRQRCKRLA
ncbi:MAG: carboxymuconolactone decarboxylase family protein [Microbacterium hominis]|nr:carboxymuconolactone decarboxylase family protein [Microbacterium hominis]